MSAFSEMYAKDYMEKVFYFCLKKTGSECEAKDLTQDISLGVLSALEKGTNPENFPAWVWKIAKNRYSHWVNRNKMQKNRFLETDISEMEIADDSETENRMIHEENISLLRRELAFIASEYREILVAFYIDDCKTKDIASKLGIPESTVRNKLLRARKRLKEGISMARTFGTKSYNPEEIRFAASGSQPSGLPWTAVSRKIPCNILIEADNNPVTKEELAMELGVALPYMEEEIALLERATLLKKVGNKYITDFFIADKECQMEIYRAQRRSSKERTELVDRIADDMIAEVRKIGAAPNNMPDGDIKWWLVIHIIDRCLLRLQGFNADYPEKRANGETWGFIGYEKTTLPENCAMSHNGTWKYFWEYVIYEYPCFRDRPTGGPSYEQIALMADILQNRRKYGNLSDAEKEIGIDSLYAHFADDGALVPHILVFENDTLHSRMHPAMENHPLFSELVRNVQEAFDETVSILCKNSSPILHNRLAYYASMNIFAIRMMTVHDEVEEGKLLVPDASEHSAAAMYMDLP